jgi:exopolysaccharide biosynthesis polyprenyl glycosylphosphotransferase
MAFHVLRKRSSPESKEGRIGQQLPLNLDHRTSTNPSVRMNKNLSHLDQSEKAARMLEIYTNRSFNSVRSAQRMRLQLVTWVIRSKITQDLKRLFDLIIATVTLFFVWPVMLLVAIAIKLESPGPIIFRQVRVGKHSVQFDCFKFRSMCVDAEARKAELMDLNEADEVVFKIKKDPRVTRVGSFIRKYSLDELPQIFNVIKGEMSLVGPRPPVPPEVEFYQFDQLQRLSVTPGITGLPQVSGRSDLEFKRWIELDLQYIAEQSFWRDVEILLRTIPAVLFGRGAY